MKYISAATEFKLKNSCVTLGKFDGLHRGHQLLLSILKKYESQGLTSVMYTFCLPERNLIYTEEEKRELLQADGPEILISYPLDKKNAAMEPEEFIEQILIRKTDARIIVVGEDFRFGRNRRGDVRMLKDLSEKFGYACIVCKKIQYQGQVVSSTLIRKELELGRIDYVNQLLGREYHITGTVIYGRQLGRTLGIPTVNLLPEPLKILPAKGVYMSLTRIDQEQYQGITNIGCKPTVNGDKIGVETHLFDVTKNLYGRKISVTLFSNIREERKFSSINQLQEQMQKDILTAKQYFNTFRKA